MVQIKLGEASKGAGARRVFISHMVQIKPHILTILHSVSTLYIPYGSNKTLFVHGTSTAVPNLYIPYGSNKTRHLNQFPLVLLRLYIPYGSNKTIVKQLSKS